MGQQAGWPAWPVYLTADLSSGILKYKVTWKLTLPSRQIRAKNAIYSAENDKNTLSYLIDASLWVYFRCSISECQNVICTVHTQIPVYHCHKPVLLGKWPLLQVCYKS